MILRNFIHISLGSENTPLFHLHSNNKLIFTLTMDNGIPSQPNSPLQDSEIDISLVEYNLSLSYEERLQQHQEALNLFLLIQEQGKKLNEQFK